MDISIILKMAGLGIIVTAICQSLSRAGREEQAVYVSIAGIIAAMIFLIHTLSELFELVKDVFMF